MPCSRISWNRPKTVPLIKQLFIYLYRLLINPCTWLNFKTTRKKLSLNSKKGVTRSALTHTQKKVQDLTKKKKKQRKKERKKERNGTFEHRIAKLSGPKKIHKKIKPGCITPEITELRPERKKQSMSDWFNALCANSEKLACIYVNFVENVWRMWWRRRQLFFHLFFNFVWIRVCAWTRRLLRGHGGRSEEKKRYLEKKRKNRRKFRHAHGFW